MTLGFLSRFVSERSTGQLTTTMACVKGGEQEKDDGYGSHEGSDLTYFLPDECLARIFRKLGTSDCKQCSLVCKRWHWVEAQTRERLHLHAHAELLSVLPSLFHRFEHITKLTLRCNRQTASIDDKSLILVAQHCLQLKQLKLKCCKQLTDEGIEQFSSVCAPLKKISFESCNFGARGVNSILSHCSLLEDLTLRRLKGLAEGSSELIGPGCCNIQRLCLKELFNAQLFSPLIAGSKNLRSLLLSWNTGNWDKPLETISENIPNLVELYIERLHLSDRGLQAIAKCASLEVLCIVKVRECTNYGLAVVADGCRHLKKFYVDGWKYDNIGDEGLIALAKKCRDLRELLLTRIDVNVASLGLIASNCLGLESLALYRCETVGDTELSCIAVKCLALRRLCIRNCPISDEGMKALASGSPCLVRVKVKNCKGVTLQSASWLQVHRPSLNVSLDCKVHTEPDGMLVTAGVSQMWRLALSRLWLTNVRLALVIGASLAACTLWLWSSSNEY